MKKFTHALIACKAVERLKMISLSDQNRPFAEYLINWFADHKDGVIRGAWYPDSLIADNSTSHIYKHSLAIGDDVRAYGNTPTSTYALPSTSMEYDIGRACIAFERPCSINKGNNLPERCEALSHAVIDNLRIRESEPKGSPLTPSDNHVALLLFMLSHYVADAHMPMHCDARDDEFPGFNIHAAAEEMWEREVVRFYKIDRSNQRFLYNESGFPLLVEDDCYADSVLKAMDEELDHRPFRIGYGDGNDNVREFMLAVSYFSWLTCCAWLPLDADAHTIDRDKLQTPAGLPFQEVSVAILADAIDAVARVWLHDLRRYCWWEEAERSR